MGLSNKKNWTCERLEYFQILLSLCTFNNDEYNNYNNFNDIYLDELELKKEDGESCNTSFLDLPLEVHDRKFTTDLFDKRNAFPFLISCTSYLDSNILSNIFYASVGSEILHIAIKATDLINIVTGINILLIRIKKQESVSTRTLSLFKKDLWEIL